MKDVELVTPERRLRIAVVADFEGPHARSWVRWFIARGHDVHCVSYYGARIAIEGATMHALRPGRSDGKQQTANSKGGGRGESVGGRLRATALSAAARLPRGVVRMGNGARYRIAGLRGALQRIDPDVVHAHFVVEHGFYAALAGVHPLVVTAWGSDVLVEPRRDAVSRWIARWTVGRADLVTSNNAYMARAVGALGALPSQVEVVTLGAERYDLERADASVNRMPANTGRAPVVISTRAHEPLYNVGEIIDAHAIVARGRAEVRLVIAHGGSLTDALRQRAAAGGGSVEFAGYLDRGAFRDALAAADVFVSVPSSDGTSVALLQAMAAGAFPVVSDLPTQHEWIRDGVNGFLVPLHRPGVLADRIATALDDAALRRRAADLNRGIVEERGLNEQQMARMEDFYYRLARPES